MRGVGTLRRRMRDGNLEVQQLLIPEPMDLPAEQAALVLEAADALRELGLDVSDFGGNTILLSSYPGSIWYGPIKLMVFSLLPAGFIVLLPVQLLRVPDLQIVLALSVAAVGYLTVALLLFNAGLRRYRRGLAPA